MNKLNKNLLLFFLSASVFLLSAELILECYDYLKVRAEGKQHQPYYSFSCYTSDGKQINKLRGYLKLVLNPFSGYTHLPNQVTPYFSINSQGFRAKKEYQAKTGQKRIIVVGGSTAFGTGLLRDEDTFCAQLEKLLPDSEVINAAVIGYHSGQEMVYLLTDLIDLKPDLIIALDGANDAYRTEEAKAINAIGVSGFRKVESQLRESYILTESNFIVRLSSLYKVFFPRLVELAGRTIRRIKKVTHKSVAVTYMDDYDENDLITASRAYAKNISKMSMIARASNCKFICLFQPTQLSSGTRRINSGKIPYDIFRSEAKKYFQEKNILYADLNEYGARILKEFYMDDGHLDAKGNLVLAEVTCEIIKNKRLLEAHN